jgi:hypothetical protein
MLPMPRLSSLMTAALMAAWACADPVNVCGCSPFPPLADPVTGNNQEVRVGSTALPVTFRVRVGQRAVPLPVTFRTVGGRGTVTPVQASSGADGMVRVTWTVGPRAGVDTLEVIEGHPGPGDVQNLMGRAYAVVIP